MIISQNWSQIKHRAKVLKLNSNKLSELYWSIETTYTYSIMPSPRPLDSVFGPIDGPYKSVL